MKTMTIIAPNSSALMLVLIESWPSDGPTTVSNCFSIGAGSAPWRSTITRSCASFWISWNDCIEPIEMRAAAQDRLLEHRRALDVVINMIAIRLPTLFDDSWPNSSPPSPSNVICTYGLLNC